MCKVVQVQNLLEYEKKYRAPLISRYHCDEGITLQSHPGAAGMFVFDHCGTDPPTNRGTNKKIDLLIERIGPDYTAKLRGI